MNKKFLTSLILIVALIGVGYYLFKANVGTVSIPKKTPVSMEEQEKTDNPLATLSSLPGFRVPEGFALNIFARDVSGARVMEVDPRGRLLVSQTKEGKVVALIDTDGNGIAEEKKILASGLKKPHGMALDCSGETCFLYVAESDALSRFTYDADGPALGMKNKLMNISSSLIDRHFTRSLLFLPPPDQDTLLISVGSSCDVCYEKEDSDYAKVISYNTKTGQKAVYARGLRNAVFMELNPVSGQVFATEMGRDNLGDDLPPDEINIIQKGKNFGWPICYGKNIHDTTFDRNTYIRNPCLEPFETMSFVDLQAHSAPLGLSFIPEEGWPEEYWYDLLVAYHGSWNRTIPTGYKIVRIKINAKGEYLGTEDFITGWLTKEGAKVGRPADIKVLSGGVAYISDDDAGIIYKLSRIK